jgi:hypothetical protein
MQLNTTINVHIHGMVLNEAEDNPNLYTRHNLFRGETTVSEILSPQFLRMCLQWQESVIQF